MPLVLNHDLEFKEGKKDEAAPEQLYMYGHGASLSNSFLLHQGILLSFNPFLLSVSKIGSPGKLPSLLSANLVSPGRRGVATGTTQKIQVDRPGAKLEEHLKFAMARPHRSS
jgi:hypothetical protein